VTNDDFVPTRRSLLTRLRSWDDQQSWKEFFDAYGQRIYRVARKAGLSDAEAQDVVQDTVIIVARKMPGFKYDPARGSFKSWLLLITRRRIEKQLKKRMPLSGRSGGNPSSAVRLDLDETARTATVERIADPKSFDFEAAWEHEWEQQLWSAALARVKTQVKPKQFQMFDLLVLKEWPVKEVARALNVSVALVYVNKHRVRRLLQHEVGRLRASTVA
jgi:RNA polymerase sigma-70 factor (ECF subfamily)